MEIDAFPEVSVPEDLARQATSDVCVIIRMFNEASVLDDVLHEVLSQVDDVICVDDGSWDGSGDAALAAGATVVRHPHNLGGGAALQTGLTYALRSSSATYFVTFDADGQHLIADALRMVQQARASGADVILGSRFLNGDPRGIPTSRRLVLRAGLIFTRLTSSIKVTDTHNGLRVFNRRALEHIHLRLRGMAYASELLDQISRSDLRYEEFPVTIRYTDYSRRKGQPSVNALNIAFDVLLQKMRAVG